MIKVAWSREALLKNLPPKWVADAAAFTERNRKAGAYIVDQNIWTDVKQFLMPSQYYKCAYCETLLGSDGISFDVEHFRPKARVFAWPKPKHGSLPAEPGYHLLAYDVGNYLLACKVCNSVYKRNFFPTADRRRRQTQDPTELARERPLLINPLDPFDIDPTRLITFRGTVPQPVAKSGRDRHRAETVIAVLRLDTRETLIRARAKCIVDLWDLFIARDAPGRIGANARQRTASLLRPTQPHHNCTVSFHKLCQREPDEAEDLRDMLQSYLDTIDANLIGR